MATTYSIVQQITAVISALSQQFSSSETFASQENPVWNTFSVPADDVPYALSFQGADRVRAFCAKVLDEGRCKLHINGNTALAIPVDPHVALAGSASGVSDGVQITSLHLRNSGAAAVRVQYFMTCETD